MSRENITKGVHTLKKLAINIRSFMAYLETKEKNDVAILTFIDEMNNCCSILTELFENEFTNMIAEKARMEDDGK